MLKQELLTEINLALEKIWLDQPADIAKMLSRNVDNGKNFSVWTYCYGHTEALASVGYTYYLWGKQHKGELETIKTIATDEMHRYAGIMKIYYYMDDMSGLLDKASEAYAQVESYEEFALLSQTLQHYLVQMSYWVDMSIPWDKVSAAFSQIMKEQAAKTV